MLWNVNGKEYPLLLTTPAFSLKIWIKDHTLWSLLIGVGLLLIIAMTMLLILHIIKKRKQELLNIEAKQQEIQQDAEANRKALEDFRQQKEQEEHVAKVQEQEKQFAQLMHVKNFFPQLRYTVKGIDKNYIIHKSETTIGRDYDNDCPLLFDSVSRHHAKIIFNGSGFEIQDLGSTNKVIVNGSFVQRTLLTTGDIIGLGELIIYFYN